MKEAKFYYPLDNERGTVKCTLCSHGCIIQDRKRGLCGVRENREGVLYSLVYGNLVALNIDPIEKKPLFQFLPGSLSFSIATMGCNFRCRHCQNAAISQVPKDLSLEPSSFYSPGQIVGETLRSGCKSISYTYTEPTVFLEFALDTAILARQKAIKNVFVSNGYTSEEATKAIAPYLDANNIDLKGDDEFYKTICGARLQPVLDTIKRMKDSNVWVEITTLVIPTLNDSEDFLHWAAGFIKSVDPAMPWHITRFYPTYQLTHLPPTPLETLQRAREIGLKTGLKYVYTGNVPGDGGEHTYCPNCKRVVIERLGFAVRSIHIKDSRCTYCGYTIDGVGLP